LACSKKNNINFFYKNNIINIFLGLLNNNNIYNINQIHYLLNKYKNKKFLVKNIKIKTKNFLKSVYLKIEMRRRKNEAITKVEKKIPTYT
jgi:hypothetical protein